MLRAISNTDVRHGAPVHAAGPEQEDHVPLPVALGVDIGGTKIAVALVDAAGRAIWPPVNQQVPFDANGVADAEQILHKIGPYVEQARAGYPTLCGIGISLCGPVNPHTGESVLSPNLHWRNVPFGAMAAARFGLPVAAATDVRHAALGEAQWGAARGVRHFAWVTVGTGYGGYLFLNGAPFEGAHDFAGNFGHNTVDEVHGELCGCGRRGCVETYVAGPAIARQGQRAADCGDSFILRQLAGGGPVTTAMVFQAEAAGDAAAAAILSGVVRRIAISLGSLVNTLDLEMIVMGGGVMRGSPDFLARIDQATRAYLMTDESQRELRIVAESWPNAAVIGAAAGVFVRCGVL